MTPRGARQHPYNGRLALFSSGDLAWREHLLVTLHCWTCDRCRRVVSEMAALRKGLRRHHDAMPFGVDWNSLSSEMKANIHLGLDVSAIVTTVPRAETVPAEVESVEPMGWRAAIVVCSLALVAISGWYLRRIDPPVSALPQLEGSVLHAGAEGVEFAQRGSALTLLTPAQHVRMDVVAGTGVRARYVDSESGQVTISHVYSDAE